MTGHGRRSAHDWFRIGESELARGRLDEAHHAFESAVVADGSHANALFRLGEIAQRDGELASADSYYRRALSADPDHAQAHARLSQISTASVEERPPYGPYGDGVVGILRAVRQSPVGGLPMMTFRPDLFDWFLRIEQRRPAGASGRMLSARMRGHNVVGDLQPGDWIELPARWRPGGKVNHVTNLMTDERVTVNQGSRVGKGVQVVLTLFVFAWIAVLFVMGAPHLFSSP